MFEVRGVQIAMHLNCALTSRHTSQESCNEDPNVPTDSIAIQKCNAISHNSVCFSILLSCKFWKDSTLIAIAEHGILLDYNEDLKTGKVFAPNYLPESVNIMVLLFKFHIT